MFHAIWIIMVADFTMSLDNVLGVAGASKGSALLLWFGLGLSIPLVMFASGMLSKLMDRFPVIVLLGAMVLERTGSVGLAIGSGLLMLVSGVGIDRQSRLLGPQTASDEGCRRHAPRSASIPSSRRRRAG